MKPCAYPILEVLRKTLEFRQNTTPNFILYLVTFHRRETGSQTEIEVIFFCANNKNAIARIIVLI